MAARTAPHFRAVSGLLLAGFLACASAAPATAQEPQTPAETVEAFHMALASGDTGRALSLLDPQVVVFEFGVIDSGAQAYATQHLPADMEMAAKTERAIESRQVAGGDSQYWVLSTYRVTSDDKDDDFSFMETAILRRSGDRFRIVHLHWSADEAGLAAATGSNQNQ